MSLCLDTRKLYNYTSISVNKWLDTTRGFMYWLISGIDSSVISQTSLNQLV